MQARYGIPICRRTNKHLKNIQKFACRVCLKRWDLSYPAMLRTLSIPTLAARRQLKLRTFFRYVNQLSIAPIANITHRVPPFQSRTHTCMI